MERMQKSNNKSCDVFALAKAFLAISPMTHKKLQKLCYYAKAWYLALYDHNLIEESFEAWVHGAVQPTLYQAYKKYVLINLGFSVDLISRPRSITHNRYF